MAMTRQSILDLELERVVSRQVPGFPEPVFMKVLKLKEREAFERRHEDLKKNGAENVSSFRARLAVATLCDQAGELLFTEGDIPLLEDKWAASFDYIADQAMALSGITKTDLEKLAAELKNGRPSAS